MAVHLNSEQVEICCSDVPFLDVCCSDPQCIWIPTDFFLVRRVGSYEHLRASKVNQKWANFKSPESARCHPPPSS